MTTSIFLIFAFVIIPFAAAQLGGMFMFQKCEEVEREHRADSQ